MRIKTSQQLLITLLVLTAGIIILAYIVILPSIRVIRDITDSIATERKKIQSTVQRALTIRELTEQLATIGHELPSLENMLITSGKEIELFNILEQESRKFALTETLRLEEASIASAQLKKIPIQIDLKGSFIDTLRFLEVLEKNEPLVPIRKLSMRTLFSKTSERNAEFHTTLNGNVYVK